MATEKYSAREDWNQQQRRGARKNKKKNKKEKQKIKSERFEIK